MTVLYLLCAEAPASVFFYPLLCGLLFPVTVLVSFPLSMCILSFWFVCFGFSSLPLFYSTFSVSSNEEMKERNSLCSPLFSVIFSLLSISLLYFISLLFFRLLDCLLSFSPYHACLSLIFSLVAYLLSPPYLFSQQRRFI